MNRTDGATDSVAGVVGSVVGSYQIIRKLGEGGMGAVYLAEHTLLGRRAAIKMLLPMLSARPDVVNRFFNEARATTSISDPGIVQIFDFGYHTDGSAYIVMEYLEGEPLDRRLASLGRMPVVDALAADPPDRQLARRRARPEHRPPRSQAREHLPRARRRGRVGRARRRSSTSGSPSCPTSTPAR